jgi:hypothetical protein
MISSFATAVISGDQLMLEPSETNGGYAASFPIGLELP